MCARRSTTVHAGKRTHKQYCTFEYSGRIITLAETQTESKEQVEVR